MANGDIYRAKFNCSVNDRPWSFNLHYEEIEPISNEGLGDIVAQAVLLHLENEVRNCLCDDGNVESCQAFKLYDGLGIAGSARADGQQGTRPGEALPLNNALFIKLNQTTGPAKFNGGIFLGGQSQTDQVVNNWEDTFLTTQVQALADKIELNVPAVAPEDGLWRPVILSRSFVPPATPKGTPLPVTSADPVPRVLTQRRRQTKTRGWAGA